MVKYKKEFFASQAQLATMRAQHTTTQKRYRLTKMGFIVAFIAALGLGYNQYAPGSFDKVIGWFSFESETTVETSVE